MPYAITTAPASEPLTTAEAKSHLRVAHSDEDTLIDALVAAAREHVEERLWRSLITQTVTLTLNRMPSGVNRIWLPRGPVQSITSMSYVDADGDSQSYTTYQQSLTNEPAYLVPAYEETWPVSQRKPGAVTIVYQTGYGASGSDVPDSVRAALKLIVGDLYMHRENFPAVPIGSVTESTAVDALLRPYSLRDERLLPFVGD